MSVLNIPLSHVALKRGRMLPWTEEAFCSCSTMKVDKRQSDAQGEVLSLEGKIRDTVIKRLDMCSFLTHLIFPVM